MDPTPGSSEHVPHGGAAVAAQPPGAKITFFPDSIGITLSEHPDIEGELLNIHFSTGSTEIVCRIPHKAWEGTKTHIDGLIEEFQKKIEALMAAEKSSVTVADGGTNLAAEAERARKLKEG